MNFVRRLLELVEVMILESRRTKPQVFLWFAWASERVATVYWTWVWVVGGIAVLFPFFDLRCDGFGF